MRRAIRCSAVIASIVTIAAGFGPVRAFARESGIQGTPDAKRILVNKDVDTSRYAIGQDQDDQSATGNVFFTDGRPPVFLFCETLGGNDYSCPAADRCGDTACAPYAFVGNVTLPDDFFSVPSVTRGPLSVGARQVIGSNPFGNLTKITTSTGAVRSGVAAPASAFRNEPAACPGGGGATLQCEVDTATDGSSTTVATLDYEQCVFPQDDGGSKVQNRLFRYTVPDPLPYDTGREELEERGPFVNDRLDAAGNLVQREIDHGSSLITFGDQCRTGSGAVRSDLRMRDIESTVDEVFFDPGEVHVLSTFDHVDQTILHSPAPACASIYTITAGTIMADDGRTGESFTTSYGRKKSGKNPSGTPPEVSQV